MNRIQFKQRFGLRLLNSGVLAFFDSLADPLTNLACIFRYARWYKQNGLPRLALETAEPFGRHNRYALYQNIAEKYGLMKNAIRYLEFGVAEGSALRWWVEHNSHAESSFAGFDTFTGLPEDWGDLPRGTFSTGGKPPDIPDERCAFEIGLFQQTLPAFLRNSSPDQRRQVIHIDCDLYSASLFVLISLCPWLKSGDLIFFDEFADVTHEFRAYRDFISASGRQLDLIGAANAGHKAVFEIR